MCMLARLVHNVRINARHKRIASAVVIMQCFGIWMVVLRLANIFPTRLAVSCVSLFVYCNGGTSGRIR